ncbi:hypothetical protein LJ656_27715 [Paraburkholderia sp. MMS20-SJTR3]|uniref:Uncharacterized protein n=1 Tax=Paraburkholderia sejongensis TaxID=2886946 RepID=A0ABS8K3A6_9BURK|nr:hypothetical protein [Paraburkholderia sp. MMS20-SJTR3]MCC8396384.1 hypothetical protein [Paraburkholderia sp. MMS20-SJTR3]
MVKRREFLGLLTAVGGSVVLSACGGGGGGSEGDSSTTNAANATNAANTTNATSSTASTTSAPGTSVMNTNGATSGSTSTTTATTTTTGNASTTPATGSDNTASSSSGTSSETGSTTTPPGSPDGTMIPPATSITDSQGAVWTVVNGSVYRNGVAEGNTYNVSMLIWYGGVIYHEGTGGQFYGWNGSNWFATNDPRLGGTSADGTTIPNASYIIDKVGAIWTVANGVVLRSKAAVGTTSNVALLLWYGGKLWYQSSGGQFYVYTDSDQWLPCSDPRTPVSAASGTFHGINGHYDYRYSTTALVSIMQNLGCSTYRLGVTNDAAPLNAVVNLAKAFQPTGLKLFALIDLGIRDDNNVLFTSESAAYTWGWQNGAAIAAALAPHGVTMYECGNELTRDPAIIRDSTTAGTKLVDFNNANWPLMRGVMRGMIDGVKSMQPNAQCGINFCVADVAASDALWDGVQPDGTSGHPTVRWDLTTWHNYEVYGDLFNIGSDGSGPGFDLPTYCKARYGKPFLITEWNTGPEKSQSYRADYITSRYASYYQARKTKNIQSAMYYDLDSGDATYGLMIDGVTLNQPYNAFVSYIAGHPDN